MITSLNYSFDDEPVIKFSYDIQNKIIEVYFERCFSMNENKFIESVSILRIQQWESAYSLLPDIEKKYGLDNNMGIFSMIYYMKFSDSRLEIFVNTIDNRYITFLFDNPKCEIEII